jgi:two-component system, NtrC family, sensor kinase
MNSALSQHVFALGLTSLATFLLGLFVLISKKGTQIGRIFFFYCLSISWWSFFQLYHQLTLDEDISITAARLMTAGGSFLIPTLFLHFILAFLEIRSRRWMLVCAYALSAVFAILSFTPYVVAGVAPKFYLPEFLVPGPLYVFGVLFFVACISYGHYELYKTYSNSMGQTRNQLAYLFWSSVLGYLGGSANFLLAFDVNIPLLNPFGTYAIPLYVAATSYAIVKYRLLNITVIIHKGLAYTILLGLIFVPAYLAILLSNRATPYSVPPLIAATLVFACGLWIVLKNPKAVTNRIFGFICLAVFIWLFGIFMMYSAKREASIVLWGKVAYAGVLFIPAFFYHFCVTFLEQDIGRTRVISVYFLSTLFLALLPTNYLTNGYYTYFWGSFLKAGPLLPVFLSFFAFASGLSLKRLYVGYHAKKGTAPLEATRIQYVFWAFCIGYIASADFAQSYGSRFYPVGFLFATLWVIIVSYAILKYQLLDIAATTRTQLLPYAQALALIPSYFLILGLIRVFTGSMQYILAGILLATFAILAELLVTLQQHMEKLVGKALFRKKYDAYETLTEFSRVLVAILDLNALNEKIIGTLSKVMRIQSISLFLLDREKDDYFLVASHGMNEEHLKQVKVRRLAQYLKETDRIIVKEELERSTTDDLSKQVLKNMILLQAELCVPLRNKERVIGFLNLGHKANLDMYSQEDINLLFTLGQNAAIALDNALLYEDLRRQKTLIRRTDRLRSLETIAGGFAHEIRNPLTSIKTFVQLTPQRKDDPEFVGQFGTLVCEDVARIERLIQEILDYAKYMEPKFMPENLNEVVSSCLYFVKVNADRKSVAIDKDFAENLPLVMLDRQQIKQVLLNLFLNALHAMGRDGGRLSVKTHGLVKQDGAKWVQIEVGDSGCGIPAEDLDHIFDPFYTTKHESEEREGTGLGLAIVHQIIREHGGYIEVQSEVGRGTTFYLNLPVLKKAALGDEAGIKKPVFSADRRDG